MSTFKVCHYYSPENLCPVVFLRRLEMALVGLLVCCIIWGTWSMWKYFGGSWKALTSSDHDMFQHLHSRLRSSNDKISKWCSDSYWNCFTGRSTGQAYVQFATVELANKALERNRLDSHLFFTQLWGLKAYLRLSFSIWWHPTLSLLLNFFLSLFKHRQHIGSRYIEVFKGHPADMQVCM